MNDKICFFPQRPGPTPGLNLIRLPFCKCIFHMFPTWHHDCLTTSFLIHIFFFSCLCELLLYCSTTVNKTKTILAVSCLSCLTYLVTNSYPLVTETLRSVWPQSKKKRTQKCGFIFFVFFLKTGKLHQKRETVIAQEALCKHSLIDMSHQREVHGLKMLPKENTNG